MAEDDKDSKTEQPTTTKLNKARKEGDIPRSQEINSVGMLLAGLVVIGLLAPGVAMELRQFLSGFFAQPHRIDLDPEALRMLLAGTVGRVALILAFPAAIYFSAALIINIGQTGLVFTSKPLQPKLSNLSFKKGIKKIFGTKSLVEAGKGVVKMLVVGALVGVFIVPTMSHPDKIADQSIVATLFEFHEKTVMILFLVILVMTAVAIADFAYQKWSHNEKLKMTKQEVKDEKKNADGDPKVKGRIRSLRLERHRQRMIASVSKASVVITNPTHYAVALKYDIDSMAAPVVVAKGVDYLAKRIRQVAEIHDVPVMENPPLARALHAAVEVDHEIPQEHYKAVAEVISYVMQLKDKLAS
jgi:flagellar biosynthesis protein FlhB